jgi:hypothetical protein
MTLRLASGQSNFPEADSKSLTDSLKSILSSNEILHKLDSAVNHFNETVDSLKENISDVKLYLMAVQQQYDKLSERLKKVDTLSVYRSEKIHKIDSVISKRKSRIDSLLQSNNILDGKSALNLSSFNEKISIAEMPHANIKIPSVELSNNLQVPQLKINSLTEGVVQKPMDINNKLVQNALEGTPESLTKKLDALKEFASSQQKVESLTKQAEEYSKALQDAETLKSKAKDEFIDHFEGKEEIIKKDVEDIAKLQTKYRDIADSRLLPKHKWKINAMKGKPFIERVVPGIDLQVFTGSNISIHAAPTFSYKISGTFQTGIGAFKRLTYFKKEESLRLADSYGFRFFVQAKIFKGINVFGEFERYKPDADARMIIQSSTIRQFDDTHLMTKVNLGLMNTYSVGKNIRGFFVVLYDVLQIKKFPNTAGSSARFGFQYQLKTKKSRRQ